MNSYIVIGIKVFVKPGIDVHPITDETLSDAAVIDTLVCILL